MTPHNEAEKGDIAQIVLLPGDPQRAEWIAENFLSDAVCVNRLRGCLAFTGTFNGLRVSVQATGMGLPSLSIYVHELLDYYRATTLIRLGTCGGLHDDVRVRSLVLSQAASCDSSINRQTFWPFEFSPSADFSLLRMAAAEAERTKLDYRVGPTVSSDIFYHPDVARRYHALRSHGVIAVDMETSALYTLAARFGARALSICTVVDHLVTGEEIDPAERHTLFGAMTRLALQTVRGLH